MNRASEEISRILAGLELAAVPMDTREFTKEAYNRLFPEGTVETPLGKVKLGDHQFEKLMVKGRRTLLGAMYQTLHDPVVILDEEQNGKLARIYLKSFKEPGRGGFSGVISVVVEVKGTAVAISTGKRRKKQITGKIKMARRILYEKQRAPSRTIGTEGKIPDTQRL
jgi:hypothetical protein